MKPATAWRPDRWRAPPELMRILSMRVLSMSTTSKRNPCSSKWSPFLGMRPSTWMTKPPRVVGAGPLAGQFAAQGEQLPHPLHGHTAVDQPERPPGGRSPGRPCPGRWATSPTMAVSTSVRWRAGCHRTRRRSGALQLGLAEIFEQLGGGQVFGQVERRAQVAADLERRIGQGSGQQVRGAQQAGHLVEAAAAGDDARIGAAAERLALFLLRPVQVQV